MNSQPEKLFHEKLESFQKPAPAAAWERVEAELDKTSQKGLWMKIAAGLLLLSLATFLLWPKNSITPIETLTKVNEPLVQPKENRDEVTIAPTPTAVPDKKNEESKKNKSNTRPKQKDTPIRLAVLEDMPTQITLPEDNKTVVPSEVLPTETHEAQIIASSTILYSTDEVNARFLKNDLPIDATNEEKKPSGIQKLMSLAYDIKHTDSGFGDLRQKKNEILALNFRENKRGQNK